MVSFFFLILCSSRLSAGFDDPPTPLSHAHTHTRNKAAQSFLIDVRSPRTADETGEKVAAHTHTHTKKTEEEGNQIPVTVAW